MKPDHGTKGCAYSCEGCTATRRKVKHAKRKGARQARVVDDELRPKRALVKSTTPWEGDPFKDHMTVTPRFRAENPETCQSHVMYSPGGFTVFPVEGDESP